MKHASYVMEIKESGAAKVRAKLLMKDTSMQIPIDTVERRDQSRRQRQ